MKALKLANIPHFGCGGFAVQERGHPSFTVDVAVIVPDAEFAVEKLSMNGFKQNPGAKMAFTDRETNGGVDLLPGCKAVDLGPLALTGIGSDSTILWMARLVTTYYALKGYAESADQLVTNSFIRASGLRQPRIIHSWNRRISLKQNE